MPVKLNSSGGGSVTLTTPSTASDYTLTMPAATGTVNMSGLVNEVPVGSASAPSIYSTGDTNTGVFFPTADTVALTTGGSERARIDSSGNLLVGTTSTARGAQFRITGEALLPSIFLGATTSNTYIYEGSTNVISFRTGASGSDRYFSFDTSGNGNALNGSWVNGSDIRLKENVKNLNKGLAEVLSLRPVSYNRIGVLKTEIGFIAQEVQAIAPEIIHDAGEYLGISYGNLNALLVAAIQELKADNDAMKERIAALEAK
jgi:hypothetical protein